MLEGIFEEQDQENCMEKMVVDIPVDLIRPNPYQPRKRFNKYLLDELCQSIKNYGLIQPITIRKTPGIYYELVAGERRLRAFQSLGLYYIPSIVININDNDSAVLALVENSQRENLHFLEEAEAYYNLVTSHNLTQDEIAKRMGKNPSTVSNKIRLLKLSPNIRKTIFEYGLTERHARALLKIPGENVQIKILEYICQKGLNVAKTEELIQRTVDNANIDMTEKKKTLCGAYKDLRILVNTIKQAIAMMNKSGINAQASQSDKGEYIEIKIKVPKR